MHITSDTYKSILSDPLHRKEIKAEISGTEYGEADLFRCRVSGGAYSKPVFGTCAARQLELEVIPKGDIPRYAQISIFVRLTLGSQSSEWIPKGVFYISTRQKDKKTGVLSIKAFDAMLRANQVWLNDSYSAINWPLSQREAVEDIANRMGVEIDPRTTLTEQFPVQYPVDEKGDLTMWNVLSYIAVSNMGNWVMTDEGKLLLIPFGDQEPESHYLVNEAGDAILFGGVRIFV